MLALRQTLFCLFLKLVVVHKQLHDLMTSMLTILALRYIHQLLISFPASLPMKEMS
jgi:hypothetical protein